FSRNLPMRCLQTFAPTPVWVTSIERWPIVPRTMLMPFLLARDLFPSRRRNSELSVAKANVIAIRVMLSKAERPSYLESSQFFNLNAESRSDSQILRQQ